MRRVAVVGCRGSGKTTVARAPARRYGLPLVLGLEQVYDFTPPPVLAGGFDVANVTAMDFVVSLHIAGQLHEQVRDIPPGTAIREFQFRHP
jgi:hypothetical protein